MMNNVSQSEGRKRIFPLFYKVEPGDVKHMTPCPENLPSKVELKALKETCKDWSNQGNQGMEGRGATKPSKNCRFGRSKGFGGAR